MVTSYMYLGFLYHYQGTLIMQDKDSHKLCNMFVVKRYEMQEPVMQVKGTGLPCKRFFIWDYMDTTGTLPYALSPTYLRKPKLNKYKQYQVNTMVQNGC